VHKPLTFREARDLSTGDALTRLSANQEAVIDQAFLGPALHAPERGAIEALTDALIVVDAGPPQGSQPRAA
jgi:hypothetical protein